MNQTELAVCESPPVPSGAPAVDDPRVTMALKEYLAALEAGMRPDRATFLARHPAIAAVLAGCLDGLEFLNTAAPRLCPPLTAARAAGADIEPDVPLGDYLIVREVGRGGMGVVYEARQLSLGRQVALKVLPFAAALDAKQLQRFKNEAQAAAQLHHTNIVPVYGVGVERGVHYYAMQFIDGQTLAAVIQEWRHLAGLERAKGVATASVTPDLPESQAQPGHAEMERMGSYVPLLPAPAPDATPPVGVHSTEGSLRSPAFFRTVARLGVQAAEALEHAHAQGVIHRDIKPANLLVDRQGNLWITDFGLAHCQSQAGPTMTGDLVGTLRYMSPEQALAKRVVVDHRTDVYSLGATLYELLTLEPAFVSTDRQELLRQIAFEEPRSPRRLNKAIPAELETIVLKAMEKNPAERYATAQELADDLERLLNDEPIRAKRPSLLQGVRRWARRHQPIVWSALVSAVVLLVMAVVALGVSNWLITREQGRTDQARKETEAAKENLEARVYYQTVALAAQERADGHVCLAEQLLDRCEHSPWRGWEWDYLMRLRYGRLPPLDHASHLFSMALSPNGRLLAVGEGTGAVTLWDTKSWKQVRSLDAHGSWARGVAFSPDSRCLASAGWDQKVRVWDAETGRLCWTGACEDNVHNVVFSPDGQWLASAGGDGMVRIWGVDTGQVVRAWAAHDHQIFSLAVSPDGKRLATGSQDKTAAIWDTATWTKLQALPAHAAFVLGVAFSPDGQLLATAAGDFYLKEHRGELKVWDVETGRLKFTLCGPTESVFSVAFHPNGKRLASGGSGEPTVKLWDLTTGLEALSLRGHTEAIWGVAFSPGGHWLVSASGDHRVRIWDGTPLARRDGEERHTLEGFGSSVTSVAFHPDGRYLATGCEDGVVRLWNPRLGRPTQVLSGFDDAIASLTFSADRRLFASSTTGGVVAVWDANTQQQLQRFHNEEVVLNVAFSPDGRHLAAAAGKVIPVWDTTTGALLRTLRGHNDFVISVAFSPDGRWLASAGYNGEVKIWYACADRDVRPLFTALAPPAGLPGLVTAWVAPGDQPLCTLPAHAGRASCVAFSPDGQHLVSAGMDGVFNVWETTSWERLARLPGHGGHVHRVVFSPDGKQLASGGSDATVRVWEAATGRPLLTFRGHTDTIYDVAYSPDGKSLASASLDKTVKIWDADPPPRSPARTAVDPWK